MDENEHSSSISGVEWGPVDDMDLAEQRTIKNLEIECSLTE